MDEAAVNAARSAARKVAGELGGQLPGDVEAALRERADEQARDQYVDPISLAGLVVSVASLAWTIYRDLKGTGDPPRREVVERRVRVEVRELDASTAPEQRDRIIEVVVDELMSPVDGSG